MSLRFINAVFACTQKTGTQSGKYHPKDAFPSHGAWQVAIVLASFAQDDGTGAYPGLQRLMQYTGLSRSAVYEAIETLKARRVIEEVGKRGRAREFRFLLPLDRPKRPESGQTSSPESGPNSPLSGRNDPDIGPRHPVSGLEPLVDPSGTHPPPGARAGGSPSGTNGNGSSADRVATVADSTGAVEVIDGELVSDSDDVAKRILDVLTERPGWECDPDAERRVRAIIADHPDCDLDVLFRTARTAARRGPEWQMAMTATYEFDLKKLDGAGRTKAERQADDLAALTRLTRNGREVDNQRAVANAAAYRDGHSNNGHSNGEVVACPDCGQRHDRLNRQRRFSHERRCDTCYETWEQMHLAEDGPVGA